MPLLSAIAESREAAEEYSPRRKPWVISPSDNSPSGAKDDLLTTCARNGNDSCPPQNFPR